MTDEVETIIATVGEPVTTATRGPLDRLEVRLGTLSEMIAVVCVTGMLAVAALTMADVLLRWLANSPIPALNEVVEQVFAVAIAACIPAGLARGVNLRIDLVSRHLSRRTEAWLEVVGHLFMLAFYGVLAWRIAAFGDYLDAQHRVTVILRWPQAPFMWAVGALFAYGSVVQAVITLNAARRAAALGLARSPAAWLGAAIAVLAVAVALAWGIADFTPLSAWAQGHVGAAVTIAFVVMWLLTLALIPIAAVMGVAGVLAAALFTGWQPAMSAATTEVTGFLTNSQVATLPLFLMMGSFAAASNISEDVYRLAHVVLGRFRGGLALATIGGCAGFGSLTGSSMATAVVIGKVSLPEMRARGYSPAFATGCCAAGGTLGALMPPASGPLILFALLSEASIGQLFVAAIVPGLIAVALYFLTVMLYVKVSPASAPVSRVEEKGQLLAALKRCGPAALLFGSVLGGIYSGVFTATEAAAVGAFEAFLCALFRGKLRGRAFWHVMAETTATTALIYGLIFGAQIFSFFVGVSALTQTATEFLSHLNWAPVAIIAVILVIYLALGSLMESFAVMVITVPIVTPLVLNLGYDILWWGVINLCVVETGLIHPPLGLNVFVLKSLQPDVPMATIYKGVAPFVVADLVKLVLLVAFPALTLWLASTMNP
ncbi:MAG TPA: TRAP transporter large permease subunit [Hyphomicrobiales bacterium]|nr:TRAP transporter large permease subunit [Hyphomicrobiales bacterium]